MENDILIVCAPNDFARDWLESRYADLVRDTLKEVTGGSKIGVKFVSQTQEKNHHESLKEPQQPAAENMKDKKTPAPN